MGIAMSKPSRFSDRGYINCSKCTDAFLIMKEALHDYIDHEVKKLHIDISQNVSNNTTCGSCSSKNIKGIWNPKIWSINCTNGICDKWLHEILAVHDDPHNPSINWKNADISKWPTDCYQVAKIFMPKGQDKTTNMPDDLDAAAILSLMKYCNWFRKDLPNTQILSDLIVIRNKIHHSGNMNVADSDKDSWIDMMIQLLNDLKIQGGAQAELEKMKRSSDYVLLKRIVIAGAFITYSGGLLWTGSTLSKNDGTQPQQIIIDTCIKTEEKIKSIIESPELQTIPDESEMPNIDVHPRQVPRCLEPNNSSSVPCNEPGSSKPPKKPLEPEENMSTSYPDKYSIVDVIRVAVLMIGVGYLLTFPAEFILQCKKIGEKIRFVVFFIYLACVMMFGWCLSKIYEGNALTAYLDKYSIVDTLGVAALMFYVVCVLIGRLFRVS